MSESRETWIDKSDWGDGPWQDEPDRIEWRVGPIAALMLRNPRGGFWCGYVGVPPGHAWHGKQAWYGEDGETISPDVHGGLTFADGCMNDDRPQRERVCHVPRPGESDDVWWLGFDCTHAWDRAPAREVRDRELAERLRAEGDHAGARLFDRPDPNTEYRDEWYVRREINSLAAQALSA